MKLRHLLFPLGVLALAACGGGDDDDFVSTAGDYKVRQFHCEPVTSPRHSIFEGSFTLDKDGSVSKLQGRLSESMSGSRNDAGQWNGSWPEFNMVWLQLNNQLDVRDASASHPKAGAGKLVTTFLNDNTNTFLNPRTVLATSVDNEGWLPGTTGGLHYGYQPTRTVAENLVDNPQNAYVRIFVNPADPTADLTQDQIDTLAYADCTARRMDLPLRPGGMMKSVCMTGTTMAGYNEIGTMSGYPVQQLIIPASEEFPEVPRTICHK